MFIYVINVQTKSKFQMILKGYYVDDLGTVLF